MAWNFEKGHTSPFNGEENDFVLESDGVAHPFFQAAPLLLIASLGGDALDGAAPNPGG